MKTYQVATIPGDGIGKAVVPAGQEGLQDLAGLGVFSMERWGFPLAPTILGVVLGTLLEDHVFSSLVKSDGQVWALF